ncbi:MAG: hypothetical protein ACHQUC_05010, partial [Chlamydiales bacterium]
MAGFHNEIVYAINADFRGVWPPVGQIIADGQLFIGNAIAPFLRAGSFTSPDASIAIGYIAPDITLQAGATMGTVKTLTPDINANGSAATPISGTSGNINVVSVNPGSVLVTRT